MSSDLLLLRSDDVQALLDLEELVGVQREAFLSLAAGTARLGDRVVVDGPEESAVFSYVARMDDDAPPVTKFGSVVPGNAARGLPTVSASVIALHPVTGRIAALVDADALTNLRTVAATMMAVRALHPEPRTVAVVGSGEQGRLHARTCAALLGPDEVVLTSISLAADAGPLTQLADSIAATTDVRFRTSEDGEQAVRSADLVICATTSSRPVLRAEWLQPGATVVSIGSFAADRCEVGRDVVSSADVVVDHLPTALVQAGPVVDAVREGLLDPGRIRQIGDVLRDGAGPREPGRTVYYNSVGIGVQDAAAVALLLRSAEAAGRGTTVTW